METIALPGFSEPLSSWTHLLAAGLSLVGGFFLYQRGRGNGLRLFSLLVFTFSLVFLFSMSGVYHLLTPGTTARLVLKHLDHAAIWVLIAGTFTPIHTILFRGSWRWGVLLLVWTLAITGLVLKIVFFTEIPEWLGLVFYLSLGWLGIVTGVRFSRQFDSEGFHWLWLGGVAYSIGGVIDFIEWPVLVEGVFGPHEIFHFFVILGALFHWIFIYRWSYHPIVDQMEFQVRIFPGGHCVAQALGDKLRIEADSIDALKVRIREHVRVTYHRNISPRIHLRYFQEETLSLY